jgi:vacuolar-type H+-ATPase subunit D/Vma8|tara:strand:- start:1279 stop:1467 length:189 start_codon:yes stop_codon:yes gene_type:complete
MEEFFKEYKTKPSKDILEVMQTLHEEFDKTKKILIDLTLHIEDVEKKFNLLNNEMKKRKPNG